MNLLGCCMEWGKYFGWVSDLVVGGCYRMLEEEGIFFFVLCGGNVDEIKEINWEVFWNVFVE